MSESRTKPYRVPQPAGVNKTTNELSAINSLNTTCQFGLTNTNSTTLQRQQYLEMAYNHRASQQFYGSQQQQQQQQGRGRKKEDDSDALMRLVRLPVHRNFAMTTR
jgi:hypothetical protein